MTRVRRLIEAYPVSTVWFASWSLVIAMLGTAEHGGAHVITTQGGSSWTTIP